MSALQTLNAIHSGSDSEDRNLELESISITVLTVRNEMDDILRGIRRVPGVLDIDTRTKDSNIVSVVRVSNDDVARRIFEMLKNCTDDEEQEDEEGEDDEDGEDGEQNGEIDTDDSVDFEDSVDPDDRSTMSRLHSGVSKLENDNILGDQKI